MWQVKNAEMRKILKEDIPGTGMPRITKYLIARGCEQAFVSLAAMRSDLEAAGFTPGEVGQFLTMMRNSRLVSSGSYENKHMTLTTGPGSASLADPMAPEGNITVKINSKTPVDWDPIMDALEKDWVMYENLMDGVAVQHDSLSEERELTDEKAERLREELEWESTGSKLVVEIVKELMRLGAASPSGKTSDDLEYLDDYNESSLFRKWI